MMDDAANKRLAQVHFDRRAYELALHAHDWFFEHSDDQRAWRAGKAELAHLRVLQLRLDPDGAIWNTIAPKGHGITSTYTDPTAP